MDSHFRRDNSLAAASVREVRKTGIDAIQTFQGLHVIGRSNAGITLRTGRARIELTALASDLFRFRVSATPKFASRPSWAVCRTDWSAVNARVAAGRKSAQVQTAGGAIELDLQSAGLRVFDRAGRKLLAGDPHATGFHRRQPHLAFRLSGGESFFGLGESSGPFDRRGLIQEFWNTDALGHGGINPGLRNLYTSIPFAILLHACKPLGLFWDSPARQRWNLGQTNRNLWQLEAASGEIDVYLFTGSRISAILRRYTELTGTMPMPPRWALGYHQCRYSYQSRKEVEEVARQLRRRRIPCDALYLDIHHMRGHRVFTFGNTFPKPGEMIAGLHRRGFHAVAIVDPGVKVDSKFGVYQRGQRLKAYVRTPDGKRNYVGKVWPGRSVFPDFLHGDVRRWWGREQAALQRVGVAGFWNDMNEPADFAHATKTLPENCRHTSDYGPLRHAEAHNIYGMQMARTSREEALRHAPDRRPFVITRAAYAGTQRHAVLWTGDNASSWEQLADSVQMLLNLGLSGFPFCGSDAGGFLDNCTPELYARWMQMAAFTPFFRNHTMVGTLPHEPWRFGPEVEAVVRCAIELRYQLLPYWYCLFAEAHQSGAPIMRPLLWHYQDDPVAVACGDQFLLGDSLLVAPVLQQGSVARSVYLPKGIWFDFWSGQRFRGHQHIIAKAALTQIPVFVRGGSLIPLAALRQHTGGPADRIVNLHLWPGGRSKLNWYEDDGTTMRQVRGDSHRRTIHWNGRAVRFGPAEGSFQSCVQTWRVVLRQVNRSVKPGGIGGGVRFDPHTRIAAFEVRNKERAFQFALH